MCLTVSNLTEIAQTVSAADRPGLNAPIPHPAPFHAGRASSNLSLCEPYLDLRRSDTDSPPTSPKETTCAYNSSG